VKYPVLYRTLNDPFFTPTFGRLKDQIDHIFSEFSTDERSPQLPLSVTETENGYTVTALIPGVEKDHIQVDITGNVLNLAATWATPEWDKTKASVLIHEIPSGKAQRRIEFPKDLDAKGVDAVFKNGVLTLSIPKHPSTKTETIDIKLAP